MFNFSKNILKFIIYGLIFSILGCEKQVQNYEESAIISPQIKEEIINKIYTNKKIINLCNGQRDKDLSKDSAKIFSINNDQYLVEILCFLGAYQGNYQYILFSKDSENIEIISFDSFDDSTDNLKLINTSTLTGTTEFEPSTQTLILDTKTRGLGDCGSFAKYQWKNNKFQLQEYRYKADCDEVYLAPQDYPLIYP